MKVFFISVTISILFIIVGCSVPEAPPPTVYYSIVDEQFYIYNTSAQTGCDNYYHIEDSLTQGEIIIYNRLVLYSIVETEPISSAVDFSEAIQTDTAISFSIISDNKYNDEYPAGSVLNPLFYIAWFDGYTDERHCMHLPDYLNSEWFPNTRSSISGSFLTEPPDSARTHRFFMQIEYKGNKVFQNHTVPIIIKP